MTRIHIFKTNRRIKESPFLTACKEQGGLLGNIEMNHITNFEDIVYSHEGDYRVDPGSNLKRSVERDWYDLTDRLNKPGVFDKLFKHFKK